MMFGERVKLARKSRGILQNQLAAAVGISRAEISNIENGKRMPGRKSAEAIGGILEFDWRKFI